MADEQKELAPNLLNPEAGAGIERLEATSPSPETPPSVEVQQAVPAVEAPSPVASEQAPVAVAEARVAKDKVLADVEEMLADGLDTIYNELAADKKALFKTQGEALAHEIRGMLAQRKVRIHRARRDIRRWVSVVPGINRYYLEQMVKIKTDDVVRYAHEAQGTAHNAM